MSTRPTEPLLRRRGSALETALLDAAWEELKEVGYKNLTFDNVALRAGTSKAVLYRRWRNRPELVRAVLRAHNVYSPSPAPDTGTLRGDVIAFLTHIADNIGELPPDAIWGLMADVVNDDPEQNTFVRDRIREANIQIMTGILQHAVARGEVNLSELPSRLLAIPADLARHEMLLTGKPPTQAAINEIVDDVFLPLITRGKSDNSSLFS